LSAVRTENSGPSTAAIGVAEFSRLMRDLGLAGGADKPKHICVGVSGGSDSMALTLLAAQWAAKRGIAFTALSVDHGLRPGARAEVLQVGAWLAARGIAHQILTWRGVKPKTNIQAQARDARYRLLGAWCRRHGVRQVLLAHHQEDQAETFLLRLTRGSGVDGLAAMAPLAERQGMELLRPLLGVAKSRLTVTCEKFKQPWIDDPSNQSERFARVRMRRLRTAFEDEGLSAARLAATAARMAQAMAALNDAAGELVAQATTFHPQGYAEIDAGRFTAAPREIGLRALSRVLKTIGGGQYRSRYDRLNDVFDALVQGELQRGRTLAGCHLTAKQGLVRMVRENRHVAQMPLKPGETVRWDGRFEVRLMARRGVVGRGLHIAVMGRANWSDVRKYLLKNQAQNAADHPAFALPSRVRQTLPALWRGFELIAVPHLGFALGPTGQAFKADFRPL